MGIEQADERKLLDEEDLTLGLRSWITSIGMTLQSVRTGLFTLEGASFRSLAPEVQETLEKGSLDMAQTALTTILTKGSLGPQSINEIVEYCSSIFPERLHEHLQSLRQTPPVPARSISHAPAQDTAEPQSMEVDRLSPSKFRLELRTWLASVFTALELGAIRERQEFRPRSPKLDHTIAVAPYKETRKILESILGDTRMGIDKTNRVIRWVAPGFPDHFREFFIGLIHSQEMLETPPFHEVRAQTPPRPPIVERRTAVTSPPVSSRPAPTRRKPVKKRTSAPATAPPVPREKRPKPKRKKKAAPPVDKAKWTPPPRLEKADVIADLSRLLAQFDADTEYTYMPSQRSNYGGIEVPFLVLPVGHPAYTQRGAVSLKRMFDAGQVLVASKSRPRATYLVKAVAIIEYEQEA